VLTFTQGVFFVVYGMTVLDSAYLESRFRSERWRHESFSSTRDVIDTWLSDVKDASCSQSTWCVTSAFAGLYMQYSDATIHYL
jgi:hypothetical protein